MVEFNHALMFYKGYLFFDSHYDRSFINKNRLARATLLCLIPHVLPALGAIVLIRCECLTRLTGLSPSPQSISAMTTFEYE